MAPAFRQGRFGDGIQHAISDIARVARGEAIPSRAHGAPAVGAAPVDRTAHPLHLVREAREPSRVDIGTPGGGGFYPWFGGFGGGGGGWSGGGGGLVADRSAAVPSAAVGRRGSGDMKRQTGPSAYALPRFSR
jgi:hypothetical protein